MGCACIAQKELVKQKDIDISCDFTNPYLKETNDTINFKNKIGDEIFKEKKEISHNQFEIKDISEITFNKEHQKKNNKSEKYFVDLLSICLNGKLIIIKKRKLNKFILRFLLFVYILYSIH